MSEAQLSALVIEVLNSNRAVFEEAFAEERLRRTKEVLPPPSSPDDTGQATRSKKWVIITKLDEIIFGLVSAATPELRREVANKLVAFAGTVMAGSTMGKGGALAGIDPVFSVTTSSAIASYKGTTAQYGNDPFQTLSVAVSVFVSKDCSYTDFVGFLVAAAVELVQPVTEAV